MSEYMKVLAIDGGGIRGIIPALILDQLETRTGKQTWEMFDLIAGTSTGGLLALALTCPDADGTRAKYQAADLVRLYEDRGKQIFAPQWKGPFFDERYPSSRINAILDEYFGEAMLRDALTEVIVTSYEIERRRPIVFKRRHARSEEPKRREHDFTIKQIARATSAAPTYFEPQKIDIEGSSDYMALVDGGVYANNPALCAYIEAHKLRAEGQNILLVTLGTGQLTHPLSYDEAKDWGLLNWARQIIDIVFDGVSDNVEYLIDHLKGEDDLVYRLQTKLDEPTAPLDKAEAENLRALRLLGDELAFENREMIEEIATRLTA